MKTTKKYHVLLLLSALTLSGGKMKPFWSSCSWDSIKSSVRKTYKSTTQAFSNSYNSIANYVTEESKHQSAGDEEPIEKIDPSLSLKQKNKKPSATLDRFKNNLSKKNTPEKQISFDPNTYSYKQQYDQEILEDIDATLHPEKRTSPNFTRKYSITTPASFSLSYKKREVQKPEENYYDYDFNYNEINLEKPTNTKKANLFSYLKYLFIINKTPQKTASPQKPNTLAKIWAACTALGQRLKSKLYLNHK